jgi:hypothetical protein
MTESNKNSWTSQKIVSRDLKKEKEILIEDDLNEKNNGDFVSKTASTYCETNT